MPSRPLSTGHHKHRTRTLLLAIAAASSSVLLLAVVLLLLVLLYLYFSFHRRSPTLPFDAPAASATVAPLRLLRFSYQDLRSATRAFDPSRSLGRGASASVYRGILPDGKSVAVKLLSVGDPTSTSDREFQNELQVLAGLPPSPFVVSLLGYCVRRRHQRRLLVYEYMPNGSLQEALFGSLNPSDLNWDRRFRIILDVAQALQFLHLECDPPVIHGDIKPSNVLLGSDFRAKIADFGLSRIKSDLDPGFEIFSQEIGPSQDLWKSQDLFPSGSPKVNTSLSFRASSSSNVCKNYDRKSNPNAAGGASPKGKEAGLTVTCDDELYSVDNSKESNGNSPLDDGKIDENGQWGKDWWWKQGGSGEFSSRDYVREWIGSQICRSGNPDWDGERKSSPANSGLEKVEFGEETLFTELGGFDASQKKNSDKKQAKGIESSTKKNSKIREWWKE